MFDKERLKKYSFLNNYFFIYLKSLRYEFYERRFFML